MNQQFIKEHLTGDVRQLALQAHRYSGIDVPFCLQQISGYQTALHKLPLWAATEGILYPVHLSMEQCSSQITAEYKASLIPEGESMADLTAGFGVDATILARKFQHLTYIEQNAELCEIARNNLPLLGIKDFTVLNCKAEDIICTNNPDGRPLRGTGGFLFLDPARRDNHGGKVVAISDCTPDVSTLQDKLLNMANTVMVKLSPMLDIKNILLQLHHVHQIHVVSVDGECKEMLVLMKRDHEGEPTITCANLKTNSAPNDIFSFTPSEEHKAESTKLKDGKQSGESSNNSSFLIPNSSFLFEPNASIMKAGCFRSISQAYGVTQLSPSSHLYISDREIPDFPGRSFHIEAIFSLNKKDLKLHLSGLKQANITIRNFPSTVAELRKRLKLNDGGDTYLFATTLADNSKVLIKTIKA